MTLAPCPCWSTFKAKCSYNNVWKSLLGYLLLQTTYIAKQELTKLKYFMCLYSKDETCFKQKFSDTASKVMMWQSKIYPRLSRVCLLRHSWCFHTNENQHTDLPQFMKTIYLVAVIALEGIGSIDCDVGVLTSFSLIPSPHTIAIVPWSLVPSPHTIAIVPWSLIPKPPPSFSLFAVQKSSTNDGKQLEGGRRVGRGDGNARCRQSFQMLLFLRESFEIRMLGFHAYLAYVCHTAPAFL